MKLEEALKGIIQMRDEARKQEDEYLQRYSRELDDEFSEVLWHRYVAYSDMRIAYEDCLHLVMQVRKDGE